MAEIPGFQHEPLAEMVAVGPVGARSVRLWVRACRPGRLAVRWWPEGQEDGGGATHFEIPEGDERDHTGSVGLPSADVPAGALSPLRRYRYRISYADDDRVLGEGAFETAPARPAATPQRFSVAVMSCNQPFDRDGALQPSSAEMLRAARRCLEDHNAQLVFTLGDQMYSDSPPNLSLFDPGYFDRVAPPGRDRIQDCTAEEVRRLFQQRYRLFWNHPDWQALHARFPCCPILDDHDMVDNWGSDPAHQTEEWRAFERGARLAYLDYQGSRVLPPSDELPDNFHYTLSYGHTAAFVMDLRSERRAGDDGRLFSEGQATDLRNFLRLNEDKKVLLFALSVPVVHLPRAAARAAARFSPAGEDFSDRWSSGAHLRDRDLFLRTLHEHQLRFPEQRVVLLSGDIHIGCVHRIRWKENGPPFYQLISSPITHETGLLISVASELSIRFNKRIATEDDTLHGTVRLLEGAARGMKNPYGGLNLGLIEIQTADPEAPPKLRFLLYGHDGDEPVCVYRSPLV